MKYPTIRGLAAALLISAPCLLPTLGAAQAVPAPVAATPKPVISADERMARALEQSAPTADDERRERDDLKAQQDMATWALWMVILTSAQAIVALASIFVVVRSLRQNSEAIARAAEANSIAQAHHISERRPWLEVTGASLVGYQLTDHGLKFDLKINMRNVGSSPARNLFVDLAVMPAPTSFPVKRAEALRDRILADPIPGEGVVFPGSPHAIDTSITLMTSEITALPMELGELRYLAVQIIGAVRYETIFQNDPAKLTGFSYRSRTGSSGRFLINLVEGSVVADHASIDATERGWFAD